MVADPHLAPHWETAALITIDVQRDFLSDGPFAVAGTTEVLPNLGKLAEAFRATGRPIVHIVRLYPADGEDVDRVRRQLVQGGAEVVRPGSPGRLLAPGLTRAPGPAPDPAPDLTLAPDPAPDPTLAPDPAAPDLAPGLTLAPDPAPRPAFGLALNSTPDLTPAPILVSSVELDDEALLQGEPQRLGPAEYVLYKPRWGAFYRTRLDELLAGHGVDTLVFAGCNLPNCPRASIIEAHERDYRVVLVTDAVSQASEQAFREIAGLGTVLCTTAEAISPAA